MVLTAMRRQAEAVQQEYTAIVSGDSYQGGGGSGGGGGGAGGMATDGEYETRLDSDYDPGNIISIANEIHFAEVCNRFVDFMDSDYEGGTSHRDLAIADDRRGRVSYSGRYAAQDENTDEI